MRVIQFLPFLLGASAVLQGVLNRRISGALGLPGAVLLNATVLLLAVLLVCAFSKPALGGFAGFQLWWLVPGLCGLALVLGIPYAIPRIGAFQTFLGILVAQMVTSLAWDAAFEHRPVTGAKLLGMAMAIGGALLVNLRK